jgi:hypothetical protein
MRQVPSITLFMNGGCSRIVTMMKCLASDVAFRSELVNLYLLLLYNVPQFDRTCVLVFTVLQELFVIYHKCELSLLAMNTWVMVVVGLDIRLLSKYCNYIILYSREIDTVTVVCSALH